MNVSEEHAAASCLLGFFFDPEDGSSTFLRNNIKLKLQNIALVIVTSVKTSDVTQIK
jgi:hypothetical protein